MRDLPYAIVMGASAGALEALSAILPAFPADYPLPIFLVVHLPPDKTSVLAELLQRRCHLRVIEAEDKASIHPGHVYIAPPDYHLLVENEGYLSLSGEEEVLFSRPSIDVLFESAAEAYGNRLVGVVLSGANHDGAAGSKAIAARGGTIVVQDPERAYARAMPEAARSMCPHATTLPLDAIGPYLTGLVA